MGLSFAKEELTILKTPGGNSMMLFEIYKDHEGAYRWYQYGKAFQVVRQSPVAHKHKTDCQEEIFRLARELALSPAPSPSDLTN